MPDKKESLRRQLKKAQASLRRILKKGSRTSVTTTDPFGRTRELNAEFTKKEVKEFRALEAKVNRLKKRLGKRGRR